MTIEVVKWAEREKYPGPVVYIGRGSPLGNPFVMKNEGERDRVCDRYIEWFHWEVMKHNSEVNLEIRRLLSIYKLKGQLRLGCPGNCTPRRCHGDTVKRYLEELLK